MRVYRGLPLDRFQEEAFRAIDANRSLIVAAPTGSGKTLVAEYAIEQAIAQGRPIVYTAPIKALSNQKYRDFSARYPGAVGIVTGDVSINPRAPVIIMTTEIYRNSLFESPERVARATYVIFDEVHYMSDAERGTVWEESILFAPRESRLLCLSATISNLEDLAGWIREAREEPLEVILEKTRPVPLREILYLRDKGIVTWNDLKAIAAAREPRRRGRARRRGHVDTPLPHVVRNRHLPCLYFVFNRRRAEELAFHYRRLDLLATEERARLLALFEELASRFGVAHGMEAARLRELLARGIAYHHAGLLPTTKEIVEQCFASGLVKLLFATETFAMGVNMPARAVVFDNVVKFDGVQIDYIPCRDFQQMAGRAGRRGQDKVGFVYATVERRDLDIPALRRTLHGAPEAVQSQFNLSYASILNLYERLGEDIFQTVRRSFGVYQAHQADPRERDRAIRVWEDELRGKINVLRRLRYLEGRRLTPKGDFARKVSGYELTASELYWRGFWHRLDAHALNVLAVAIVTEPKKNEWNAPPPPEATPHKWKAIRAVQDLRLLEERCRVRAPVREIHYDAAAAVYAWSQGCPFEQLSQYTSQDPGDLVRAFRQAIQLLKQLRDALDPSDILGATLSDAVERLNRDEVDAERLLRS